MQGVMTQRGKNAGEPEGEKKQMKKEKAVKPSGGGGAESKEESQRTTWRRDTGSQVTILGGICQEESRWEEKTLKFQVQFPILEPRDTHPVLPSPLPHPWVALPERILSLNWWRSFQIKLDT